jgi:hypothetical protein
MAVCVHSAANAMVCFLAGEGRLRIARKQILLRAFEFFNNRPEGSFIVTLTIAFVLRMQSALCGHLLIGPVRPGRYGRYGLIKWDGIVL